MERYLNYGLYLFLALLVFAAALKTPLHNWDMLPYVATTKFYQQAEIESLHAASYQALKAYAPAELYEEMISSSTYRQEVFQSPERFEQILPFYTIRPIYISTLIGLEKTGMNPFFATHFVSALCVLLAFVLLARLGFSQLRLGHYFVAFPVVFAFLGYGLSLSRTSSPDAMAFLFAVVGYLLFLNRRFYLLLAFLPVLILVRTDMVLMSVLCGLYFLVQGRHMAMAAAASLVVTLAVYFGLNHYFGNYGWSTIFYFTLVERVSNPGDLAPTISIAQYFTVALKSIVYSIQTAVPFLAYVTLTVYLLIHHLRNGELLRIPQRGYLGSLEALHYLGVLYVAAHIVLFPIIWDRFFVTQYAFTTILVLYKVLHGTVPVAQRAQPSMAVNPDVKDMPQHTDMRAVG